MKLIHSFGRQDFAEAAILANSLHMEGNGAPERISAAMTRINAAASRIEAVAQAPRPTGDPELEEKYAELQRETSEALAQLDRLIGSLES